MRSKFLRSQVMALVFTFFGAILPATADVSPERSKQLFQMAAAELDAGGDFFLYVELESAMANLVGKADEMLRTLAEEDDDFEAAPAILQRVDQFLRAEGLHDLLGFGMSSVPRGDGSYLVKQFAVRRPAAEAPRFWRMMGGTPRSLGILNAIPSDAEMAMVMDFRPDDFWAFVQRAVQAIGGDEAHKNMRNALAEMKSGPGADVDAMFASLSGELALAVTLSPQQTTRLPMGEEGLEIPSPALLIAVRVKDTTILDWLARMADESPQTRKETIEGCLVRVGSGAGPDAPIPFQPAFGQADGVFFFASHPDAIRSALTALRGGAGLKTKPEFQRLFSPLPEQNNGIVFAGTRFAETLRRLQKAQFDQMREANGGMPAALLERIWEWIPQGASASVRVMKPNGILWQSVGPMGGKEAALSAMAMPLAMIAGISIPSFVSARGHAQEAALINALRIVDSAKEQWAMENNKDEGAEVTEADIAPYLKPGSIRLPPGHELKINPIGASPEIVKPDGETITLD